MRELQVTEIEKLKSLLKDRESKLRNKAAQSRDICKKKLGR